MNTYIKKSVSAMTGYVPGEQTADFQVVKLNTNENPYPPSPCIRNVLAGMDLDVLRRYPDPVSGSLRRTIADLHGCVPEQVFAGNGSDEILSLCTRVFVEDAGSIGYFNPSYSLYPVLAAIRDVVVCPVELGGHFEWRMPEDYACSLFFLTNPNAPTGILYPADTVRAFCRRFRGVVLIDEAYVDFSSTHCMNLALEFDHVLVLRTLSKAYSLAGLRMGYAVGAAPLIAALFKIKDSYNLDRLTQEVALAALRDQDAMRANVALVKQTRRRLTSELESLGFAVCPSETNFLWVKPPQVPAPTLYQRLCEQRILVRCFSGPRIGDYLRITVGSDPQTDVLLAALRRILSGY
ncbi:MAG: histidinol-phosphate transaminase [Verrucomicrobia bacterium]|nr:histidinol-phosphate transaminase [Verrucomicrobiota bacterium]MBU4290461.1 histidinol-phosphate transaminase [Verrucomicrobiota bacterium]MBU4430055.1 histidinol-phosphate transaminase [Verrucomicrobiota bacterium]MCG2681118.1 histidinol-phosphate transaminase [Kiritimatiellia bacterium]